MDISETIRRCKSGDQEAWRMIIKSYSRTVYNIALNFTTNKDNASDITQEIFIKLYQQIDKYKEEKNFYSWLLTLSKNHCIDYWRKNKKHLNNDGMVEHIRSDESTPEETAIKESEIKNLRNKIKLLDPELRIYLTLRDVQEFSYDEIAEQFNIPLGTVKSRINRARLKLAQMLIPNGG